MTAPAQPETAESFDEFCERLWDVDESDPILKVEKSVLRRVWQAARQPAPAAGGGKYVRVRKEIWDELTKGGEPVNPLRAAPAAGVVECPNCCAQNGDLTCVSCGGTYGAQDFISQHYAAPAPSQPAAGVVDLHGANFLAGARMLAEEHARSTAKLFARNKDLAGVSDAEVIGHVALDMQLLAERVARLYTAPAPSDAVVRELAQLVGVLCYRLRKHDPESSVANRASEYLKRHNLARIIRNDAALSAKEAERG